MADVRLNELPVLTAPTGEDILHALDDADDRDKQLTLTAVRTFAQVGTATAAQGARADTALQTVDLGYNAGTRTVTNTGGADAVLPLVSASAAGLAPQATGGTSNFLRADGTWAAPPAGGGGGVSQVSGTVPIDVATGTTTPVVSIRAATTSAAGSMSGPDKAKLDGVQAGATANSTDAQLRDRGTHTGTQTASTISDFTSSSRAQVEATLVAGANVTLTPSGSGATRTIAIASTAAGGGGGTVTQVTGTAPIAVASGTTTPVVSIAAASGSAAGSMSSADFTKLAGIAPGATANSTDAQLRDRSTHTGTQTASTISDFTASSRAQVEATLVAGSNVTLTPAGSGATRTITIASTAAGGASNLDGLTDVTITTPATDQVLRYNGSQWVNAASPAGGGGTVTQVDGGAGLTGSVTTSGSLAVGAGTGITVNANDVAINRTTVDTWYATAAQGAKADTALQPGSVDLGYSSGTRTITNTAGDGAVLPLVTSGAAGLAPQSGGGTTNFLRADGTWAAPPAGGGATNLDGLSDVTLTAPATDQVLKYNGTQWVNAAAPGGGGGTVTQVDGGGGLTGSVTTSGSLTVGAGTGITVNPDDVAINRAVVDTWYATAAQGTKADTAVQSVAGTAPISVSGTTTRTVTIAAASGSAAGSMSSADFTKLAGIAPGATANVGTVTSVTGTAPISVATGTSTPAITIAAATTSAPGSMSAADKTKLDTLTAGANGTVTSVTGGAGLTGAVTTTGALAVGAGTGITVNTDDVAVNRTTVDTWYVPRDLSTLPVLP